MFILRFKGIIRNKKSVSTAPDGLLSAGRESIKTALWSIWMDWRQGFWPKRAFSAPRIHKIGLIRRLSGLAAGHGSCTRATACGSVQQGAQQTMIVKNGEIERLICSGAGTSADN